MSFGFGVGDFIAVADLAWKLYRYCYIAAKDAPRDFKLLLQEICTLASSLKLLKDEVDDPESTLRRSGEDRVRMVNDMISRIGVTLEELEKYATKYENLQGVPRSKRKKLWDRFTWSIEGSEIDSLRVKISRHNGDLSLILIGAGNSSLQRLESTVFTLQRDFSEIKGYIDLFQNPKSELAGALVIDDEVFKISPMGAALMKNAETGQRRWSAIGIDEWIQAGRWWLLKSQMNLYVESSLAAGQIISHQGYADLIKAAWILVDIIGRHPQLDFLDSGIRYEVVQLTQTIRAELGNIKTLGLLKPSFDDLDSYDLNIWETQVKGPTLQPGKKNLKSGPNYQSWVTEEDNVLFQRFGHYQSSPFAIQTQCIILFLIHKKGKEAKIVVRDQSWNTLATFIGKTSLVNPTKAFVHVEQQRIGLSTSKDAQYLCAMSEAVEEYLFHCGRAENDHEMVEAFALLFAVKNNYQDVFERVLEGDLNPNSQLEISSSQASLASRIRIATGDLLRKGEVLESDEVVTDYISVFRWATRGGYDTVALLLLEAKGMVVSGDQIQEWYSLYCAACDGNIDIVAFLLSEKGVDAKTLGIEGHAALIEAAKRGYVVVVDKLLGVGVDINSIFDGRTALQAAAEGGHEAVVGKLLEAGANPNTQGASSNGHTALQAAAGGGHEAVVGKLLKAGANPNTPGASKNGRTALQAAAGGGHKTVFAMLLDAEADPGAKSADYGGRTALQAAAEGGHEALVDTLLKAGVNVNAQPASRQGRTALQAAASGGHKAVVDKLINAGASVNAPAVEYDGLTAFQAAAEGGHEELIDILLKAGADINAEPADHGGLTALQAASSQGHASVVSKLLDIGANVNALPASHDGRTALQAASGGGHELVVDKLLRAGASVNALRGRFNGLSALQAAAQGGHETVVERLLRAGADIHVVGGSTVLQWAAEGGHEAVVVMLLEAGADVNTPTTVIEGRTALQAAAGRGHEAVVDRLLKAGADINADTGRAALYVAAWGGHEAVVDKILEAGADINTPAVDLDGRTALQAAAEGGHEALVEKFLKLGADVNAQPASHHGRTALQAAAGGGHKSVVDMLLKAGATVNAPRARYEGRTAMEAATEGGHQVVINKLLKAGAKN